MTINPADEESHKTTRSGRKKFKVILDGKEITGGGATVLAETIRQIGFNRVAKLGIMMAKGEYNLVSRQKLLPMTRISSVSHRHTSTAIM